MQIIVKTEEVHNITQCYRQSIQTSRMTTCGCVHLTGCVGYRLFSPHQAGKAAIDPSILRRTIRGCPPTIRQPPPPHHSLPPFTIRSSIRVSLPECGSHLPTVVYALIMADSLVTQFNRELAAYLFRPFHDYDSIVVLLIHWEQSDDPGFKEETEKLKDFFEIELGYDVKVYPIPSQKSYWCLDYEFNTILRHLEPSTLLIVHYGGHGDPDNNKDKGQDRGSVWAA